MLRARPLARGTLSVDAGSGLEQRCTAVRERPPIPMACCVRIYIYIYIYIYIVTVTSSRPCVLNVARELVTVSPVCPVPLGNLRGARLSVTLMYT